MAFNRDITNLDISTHGVVACPDRMTGTATQNKQRFDELVREVVKEKFNGLIDDIEASSAAGNIGFSAEGYEATNVKDAIVEVEEITSESAESASESAEEAEESALKSEGYAVGTQNGEPVAEYTIYHHNNAKYYAEMCKQNTNLFVIIKQSTTCAEILNANWHGKHLVLYVRPDTLSGAGTFYYLAKEQYDGTYHTFIFMNENGFMSCVIQENETVPTYNWSSLEIVKQNLATDVQTSLGKADTSVQSVKTVNGQTMVGSGNITVAEASLSGTENPTSSVVASYVGQHYINTTTNIEWVSVAINPTVWEIVNKSLVTNRNLIDNPWFTVNQRGASEALNNGYGVDRWMGSYTVLSNGITVGSSYGALQKMESSLLSQLYGKTITGSFIDGSGNVHSGTIVAENSSTWQVIVSDSNVAMYFYNEGVYLWGSGNVKAVKLELGSISTLANDVAPNYVEELEKCKRYFERIDYGAYGTVGIFSRFSTTNEIPIHYSEKRVVPTFNMVGTYQAVYPSSSYNVTVYRVEMSTKTSTRIITSSDGATNYGHIRANGGASNYMDISADL